MLDGVLRKLFFGVAMMAAVTAIDARGAVAQPVDGDIVTIDAGNAHQTLKLSRNKSIYIDLPRDARDILVSNPGIVDAVIRTPRRLYLTAIPPDTAQTSSGQAIAPPTSGGQTNIIVFDRAGVPIVTLDVSLEERDTNDIKQMLTRLIPGSSIDVEWISGNIVISGTVKNDGDARKAQDIADAFLGLKPPTSVTSFGSSGGSGSSASPSGGQEVKTSGPSARVINLLTIQGEDQVHLKVTVAEIQRNIAKQLGVDLRGGITIGQFASAFRIENPFPVHGAPLTDTLGFAGTGDPNAGISSLNKGLFGALRALDQTGLVRTLAEPTLTSISGESAYFLAGGEFPVPTGRDKDGNITITYKPFGVSLTFTPVVLAEGRISLHVKTEVSELSTENAIQLSGLTLPAIVVRRSESTMEMPSGGAMVMGGLLQDNIRQAISGLPALQRLPVLGALFRSRDFKRNETELVIIVTPYLVKPVARTALARPDDGFNTAPDSTGDFLGRINRVYGVKGKPNPAGNYAGKYGFIFE